MLRALKLFLLLGFVWGAAHFSHSQTDGFANTKLSTTLLAKSQSPPSLPLFSQPYFYLSKGGQSYVFVSEDGQWILKFFRNSKGNSARFLHSLIPWKKWEAIAEEEDEAIKSSLKSYELASTQQGLTGIVYFHSGQHPSLHESLTIVDKLGIHHTLDPNLYPFVVQKRATPVLTKIDQLLANNEHLGAKAALVDLLTLIKERISLGIADSDAHLTKNFGFVGDKAIQIDPGRYRNTPQDSYAKLLSSAQELQTFLEARDEELAFFFSEIVKNQWGAYEDF